MFKRFKSLLLGFAAVLAVQAQDAPKYIFYYIGDGMGMGPATATEMYWRQVRGQHSPITMMQFPVAGMCLTYSASSPVTDSAAAGTALSTGSKTKNGMLGMNADTVAVTSVAKDLQQMGYGIAIVTSVAADDATPGAFFAHVPNRSMRYEVDIDAANSNFQFIAGAGLTGLKDKSGKDTDALATLREKGYTYIQGPEGIAAAETAEKVVLVGAEGAPDYNVGYTIDSIPGRLTLPFITENCLKFMERVSPDKFFMMVEGGNIDHALHANDGGAAIKETLNFNEALQMAFDFYKAHPDETLIVVTADHDTGGMTIGCPFTGYNAHLDLIDYQKVSKEQFERFCKSINESRRTFTWDDMKEYLQENLGFWSHIKLTEKQDQELSAMFEQVFVKREEVEGQKTLYANFSGFAKTVFKIFNDQAGIGFVATSHTGNPVPVFAVGVGSDRFKGLNNNIEIPEVIRSLTGANK